MNVSRPARLAPYAPRRPGRAIGSCARSVRRGASLLTQRGIARVEMVFVLITLAVLAVVSVPSFGNFVVAQRLRAAGAELAASLELARNEALRRGDVVTVRPVGDQWARGWVVATARGDSIDRRSALGGRVTVQHAPASIAFGPDGLPAAGGVRIELADADKAAGVATHCVIVQRAGAPQIEAKTCE